MSFYSGPDPIMNYSQFLLMADMKYSTGQYGKFRQNIDV